MYAIEYYFDLFFSKRYVAKMCVNTRKCRTGFLRLYYTNKNAIIDVIIVLLTV